MESKTKHRILGFLVVVGLVVIAYPFFQIKTDLPAQDVLVKAPAFPDQSVQVSDSDNGSAIKLTDDVATNNNVEQSNDLENTIRMNRPSVINQVENTQDKNENTRNDSKSILNENAPPKVVMTSLTPKNDSKKDNLNKNKNVISKMNFDNDNLIKLKSAAWVVQMGSFSKKDNALRLVNQLRANGYRAFINQVATGSSVRVLVGPVTKKSSAKILANKLEDDLHLKGWIISYNPLAL